MSVQYIRVTSRARYTFTCIVGSLREDLRQSTVDRIVERVIPLLTLKSLRVGKLIPFLEKRNVIAPDSLANLK